MSSKEVLRELKKFGNPEKKAQLQRFFKTGPGQYGEGDVFIGARVPEVRSVAKKFKHVDMSVIDELLHSEIHEARLCALLILVHNYQKGDDHTKKSIVNYYLINAKRVNNWDLVDLTAHKILGNWLLDKDREILHKLASSPNLWERRISVVACFAFIPNNDFKDILKLAEYHLDDPHDLMHKAVGWALREVGKKDEKVLRKFLDAHVKDMPRTTLRYSIEKFPGKLRKAYLNT